MEADVGLMKIGQLFKQICCFNTSKIIKYYFNIYHYSEMLNILFYLISIYFADTIYIPTKSVDSSRVSVVNEKNYFA